jgi:hypothetical protein
VLRPILSAEAQRCDEHQAQVREREDIVVGDEREDPCVAGAAIEASRIAAGIGTGHRTATKTYERNKTCNQSAFRHP